MKARGLGYLGATTLGLYLALGSALLLPQDTRAAAHLMTEVCATCHAAGETTTRSNAHLLNAEQEVLCAECHANAVQVSHPSGIRPTSRLPRRFPVDWKGEMTCSTCHRIHSTQPGLPRVNLTGEPYCLLCHDEAFFTQMRDGGTSLFRSGHIAAGHGDFMMNIDAFSLQCIECHADETNGDVTIVAPGVVRHASNRSNHPIGVDYASARAYGGYRAESALDSAILLPEGKVSCISCHEGYSAVHGKLVVASGSSGLCFSCHDK